MFPILAALLALHLQPVSPAGPNLQPQLAVSPNTVALVFGSGQSIWLARSSDQGRSFSPAVRIAELPKMLLGRHRGPRVVISGDVLLVSAAATGSDLFCWRSTDSGRTWSKPAPINDATHSAREGLHAMAADADGHVAAAWLDDRTPGGKRLYGAFSDDAGATWSKNVLLYESPSGTICQCCHPTLVALGRGEFAVMWRNVIEGSRDFYVMRLSAGKPAGPAVKQGAGTWKIDACPMDGGGLAQAGGGLISAWRREHNVYLAEPGKPETDLGPGQDIALAANARRVVAVWSTPHGIEASGGRHLSTSGAFPSIVALPDGAMLAAWEENGAIATLRLE